VATPKENEICWCGNEKRTTDCCEPYLAGELIPPTAEATMRSRYSAYVTLNRDYLLSTWHPQTRPKNIELDSSQRWLGLKVVRTEAGSASDAQGTVQFVARYKVAGRGHRIEELSHFSRVDGRWLYLTGDIADKG